MTDNSRGLELSEEMMKLRKARLEDAEGIREVYENAFPEEEKELVSNLAVDLLSEESGRPVLSMVAEEEGGIIGHVALSPVFERCSNVFLGHILAPLAVRSEWQKKGVGSSLIREGTARLEKEAEVLLVYGDPEYYGRFGFEAEVAEKYEPPYPLAFPFGWQGMQIGERSARGDSMEIECVAPLSNRKLW